MWKKKLCIDYKLYVIHFMLFMNGCKSSVKMSSLQLEISFLETAGESTKRWKTVFRESGYSELVSNTYNKRNNWSGEFIESIFLTTLRLYRKKYFLENFHSFKQLLRLIWKNFLIIRRNKIKLLYVLYNTFAYDVKCFTLTCI